MLESHKYKMLEKIESHKKLNFDLNQLNKNEMQIIKFVLKWNKPIAPNASDVSKGLDLPASTVLSTLKRMKQADEKNKRRAKEIALIFDWAPRHSITLTKFGQDIAKHIDLHHHIFELFLAEQLSIPKQEAHKESELMEINISCKLTDRIINKLNLIQWEKLCICPEENHSH